MPPKNLSLCLIVRNEARHLSACLASVKGLADEIVVVDTGSTDDTVAIARSAGAQVHQIVWPGNFSTARNVALERATGRWILVLDADETLPPVSRTAVAKLIADPPRRAYGLVQHSRLPGGECLDVAIVRLFPRDSRVRFERPIHEQVNTSLERARIPVEDTDIIFDHNGYADVAAMPAKTTRNRALIENTLQQEQASGSDRDPHLRYFYANTFLDAGEFLRAADEYAECAAQCGENRPRLEAAARIRAAESYFKAGKMGGALDALPSDQAIAEHPLAALLKGEITLTSGWDKEAVRWLEAVLTLPDVAYMPPVVVAPIKLKALQLLADAWARANRKDVAVGVLKLAINFSQKRIDPRMANLAELYRGCLSGASRVV